MWFKVIYVFFTAVCLCTASAYSQSEKLIFAIDVFRHGDRTPIIDLPSTPYSWPQGLGQLTPIGMQQEFQLGVAMRKRYVTMNALLPSTYNVTTMYVGSTDYNRTLMSAQSLLAGLYPLGTGPNIPHTDKPALPAAAQPVPIHILPAFFVLVADPNKHNAILEKYVFSQPDWQEKSKELQPHFARWSQLTGIKITYLDDLLLIGDALYIRKLYNLPLPANMTQDEAEMIIQASSWAFITMFKEPEIGYIGGHEILVNVAKSLQKASTEHDGLKVRLYAAHDSTILSLASAMHAPLDQIPPYASDLNFALLQVEQGDYVVKVTLNQKPLIIPACGGSVCTLSQFITDVALM